MKVIELDGMRMREAQECHACLGAVMDLPEYYGNNLDALFDVLTEIGEPTQIRIINGDVMNLSVKKVIAYAGAANPNLTILMSV